MINERFITDRFHEALDEEPEAGAFDRLRFTLVRAHQRRTPAWRRFLDWLASHLRVADRGRAWALTLTAVVLALAIVAVLIGVRGLQHSVPLPVRPILPLHHNGLLVIRGMDGGLDTVDPITGATGKLLDAGALRPVGKFMSDAAYSPDGTELAFIQSRYDEPLGHIWILDLGSGEASAIVTCACRALSHVSWSPDGSHIAYTDRDASGAYEIFTIQRDGTGRAQLTHLPPGTFVEQPAWSPDGAHVLFVRWLGNDLSQGTELYTVGSDGNGQAVLLRDRLGPMEPAWSPDGSTIAFITDGPTSTSSPGTPFDFQVWTMRADGSDRVRVFDGRGCCLNGWGGPVWSPDGTMMAVVSTSGPVPVEGWWLWVMNADGSGARPLLNVAPDRPAWQPIA